MDNDDSDEGDDRERLEHDLFDNEGLASDNEDADMPSSRRRQERFYLNS